MQKGKTEPYRLNGVITDARSDHCGVDSVRFLRVVRRVIKEPIRYVANQEVRTICGGVPKKARDVKFLFLEKRISISYYIL
jgi:hypothetical protein